MVGGAARSGLFGVIVVIPLILIFRVPKSNRNSKKETVQYCTLFVPDRSMGLHFRTVMGGLRPRMLCSPNFHLH